MKPFVSILESPIDEKKLRLWSLVLTSKGIPFQTKRLDEGFDILVPEAFFENAIREIELFEEENRTFFKEKRPKPKPLRHVKESLVLISIMACLMSLTFRYEVRDLLLLRGEADSGKIISGEIWRSITALTLHADPAHFLSNVCIGGLFMVFLFEEIGPGFGLFLVTLGGGLGNYFNALVHGPGHHSIGFSTSVFSCIGTLSIIKALENRKDSIKEALKIVFSGLALLALLGTGKENVDLLAHLFGFLAGMALGGVFVLGRQIGFWENAKILDKVLLAVTIIIYVVCWCMAIYF